MYIEQNGLTTVMASVIVPPPVFQALVRDLNKIYCEVCGSSWNIKRAKLGKVTVNKMEKM